MTVVRVQTIAMHGMNAIPVNVEVQVTMGLPRFVIVGLPDAVISESKTRILSALHACMPARSIVVNLSPSDIRKEGNHYDLPIALCVLAALDVIPRYCLNQYMVLGSLSLDGRILPVNSVLPAAIAANAEKKDLICPKACIQSAMLAGGDLGILAPENILELIAFFNGKGDIYTDKEENILNTQHDSISKSMRECGYTDYVEHIETDGKSQVITGYCDKVKYVDWSQIKDQTSAKRAALIALAGGHHLLLVGSPGSGKSMLANCMRHLLPNLDAMTALQTTIMHNIRGSLSKHLIIRPPFRSPHHGASMVSIIGGGSKALPGEISLANGGLLFMDEFPEFSRQTLDSLREPMETGNVTLSRAYGTYVYPARFQLIAAMNSCKCGMSDSKKCATGTRCKQLYWDRISGPLLDRFDLCAKTVKLHPWELSQIAEDNMDNNGVRLLISQAYHLQKTRQNCLNIQLSNEQLHSMLDETVTEMLLEQICQKYDLSGRGYYRMLKVARTIADLRYLQSGDSVNITQTDLLEAVSFRI